MPSNTAVFMHSARKPLTVSPSSYTSPTAGEIVIRTHAIALNPIDFIIPFAGPAIFSFLPSPFILGEDCAGDVVEVGPSSRFSIGDRVIGHALGFEKGHPISEGAFQEFIVLKEFLVAKIPDTMPYKDAVVLPLALSTAASGLFYKDNLALDTDALCSPATGRNGKTLLIWGGSTSVGMNAIQMATLAGYDVITTCSPRNFALVKNLGAKYAFDYSEKGTVSEIRSLFDEPGVVSAGAMAIGDGSTQIVMSIMSHVKSGSKATAQMSVGPTSGNFSSALDLIKMMGGVMSNMASVKIKSITSGVKPVYAEAAAISKEDFGGLVYRDFLEPALRDGRFRPMPVAEVIGTGLESVPEGLERLKKGVSAKKFVVTL